MLHHTRRWNRDHGEELHSAWLNGVGHARVGRGLRRRGSAGTTATASCCAAMVGVQRRYAELLDARRVDAARRAERRRPAAGRRVALERRRDDAVGARELGRGVRRRRVTSDGRARSSCRRAGSRRSWRGASSWSRPRGRRRRRSPRARRCASAGAGRARRRAAGRVRRGAVAAAAHDGDLPPPRDGHVRRGAVRRGVEAAAAAPARSRRGAARHGRGAALRDRRLEVAGTGGVPLTGLTLAEARLYAAGAGARLPTEDEWQLAARGGPARASAARSSGTGRRASTRDGVTRFAILKGGADWKAEGSDWYVDGGEQRRGVLAEAAARRRAACSAPPRRSASGLRGRPAVSSTGSPLDGIRVVEAATLFAAPLAGMFLADYGADVVKIEHPQRVDPARGHGPRRTATGCGSRRSRATSG